jgi:transposase-like protein
VCVGISGSNLSFRDLVEMMTERGVDLAHTTIMRWVQRYVPEFERRRNRFACKTGQSWRVDETHVKIKGRWTYLYRAVDREGKTVDFLLRAKRDVAAVKAFFRRAFKTQGRLPCAITLDGYQALHRAAREFLEEHRHGKRTKLRSSKYLTDVFDKSVSVAGLVISVFRLLSKRYVPLDGRESVAHSEVKAGRRATARQARLGLDGASTSLSFASCGMDGDRHYGKLLRLG